MLVSKRGHRTIGKLQWPPNIELCRSKRPANDGLVAFCSQQSPHEIVPLVAKLARALFAALPSHPKGSRSNHRSPGQHVEGGSLAEIFVARRATRWLRLYG